VLSTISIADALRSMEGVSIAADEIEDDFSAVFAESPEPAEDAVVLEGDRLTPHLVPATGESGFTHFADGAQFSRPAFYDRGMPGRYAFLNAAVAIRKDRVILDVVQEASSDGIFAPFGPALARLQEAFEGEIDVHSVRVDATDGMARMGERVADTISVERNRLELKVCTAWLNSGEPGSLLVDGTIGQLPKAAGRPAGTVVGLVKSHRKQYFTSATAPTILGLKEGERSSVFVVPSRRDQDSPTHSWYLRLRSDPYKSPAFGLVRVELPDMDGSVEAADRISGWAMAERSPLSLPDFRYDRLLYPIRAVELLLKARHPSRQAVRALIGA
jgi:hypothetical protein